MARRLPFQISVTPIEREKISIRARGFGLTGSAYMLQLLNEDWRNAWGSQSPIEVQHFLDGATDIFPPKRRVRTAGGQSRRVPA